MGLFAAIGTKLFTWALEKAGLYLANYFKVKKKLSKKAVAVDKEVRTVENLVVIMKARRRAKLPIPKELQKELKDAMAALSRSGSGK
jgi:LytS/YehU family sensor histidine kinase